MKTGDFFLFIFTIIFIACNARGGGSGEPVPKPPVELSGGETLFNNHCAACHGNGAQGTDRGPTFLSKIYEPNHHGDAAFQRAPQSGVRAHHWRFGDMPKVSVTPEEINTIIPYIRWLQKEAGIF